MIPSSIPCPSCRANRTIGCDLCRNGAQAMYIPLGHPRAPLSWFVDFKAATRAEAARAMVELAAVAQDLGRDVWVYDRWQRARRPEQVAQDLGGYANTSERWSAVMGAIHCNAIDDEWHVRDLTVEGDAVTEQAAPPPAVRRMDPDLGVESQRIAGLWVLRRGTALVFTWAPAGRAAYWEAWDVQAGRQIGAADRGEWPREITTYVRERLAAIPPSPANEKAALTANQRAAQSQVQESHKESPVAPMVGAPVAPRQQDPAKVLKENPVPMIDPTNPAALAAARETVRKMKEAIGVYALNERRAEIFGANKLIERAYREAEANKDAAERAVKKVIAAMAERDQELVLVATAETGADGKKKYTADGAKAAATTARKADEEYAALRAALNAAEAALEGAERDFAIAKADQRALVREADQLKADTALVTAGVTAFGALDVPAPPTAQAA